ncbi:MAG: pteridine reductase [Pseudomonadota bacterium]
MSNRLALVTGGAQRIGAAIARELHASGFTIALHYRQSRGPAEALADELCAARPDSCHLYAADLARLEDIKAMATKLLADHGALDVVVNNASVFAPTPIEDCSEAQYDAMLDTNLKAPYFLVQQLLSGLRARQGVIINIVDVHAEHPARDYNAYCAAKAGLASLTRSLALELAPSIRANGVAPGAILWPQGEADYDEDAMRSTLARTPLGRLGEPADIAKAVRFLVLDAPFITGQVLAVDGGRTLEG